MRKLLKEWRKYLEEISKSELKYFGQEFEELMADPALAQDKTWIANNMGKRLGGGYSRVAYELKGNPELVWKTAYNSSDHPDETSFEEGSYTNAQEAKYFNRYPDFFPKVYMTGEATRGYDPETGELMGGTYEYPEEKAFMPWLIIDRVHVILDDGEYDALIHKVFPVMQQAVNKVKAAGVPIRTSMFASTKRSNFFIKTMRYGNYEEIYRYFHDNVLNHPRSPLDDKQREELAYEITDMITKDYKMSRLLQLFQETGADAGDIRIGNVGTDLATKSKFIILDISKFLFQHGREGSYEFN